MPITNARGHMYPFVTHCHNPIKGGCHEIINGFGCRYCYMKFGERAKSQYYQGPLTLYPKELDEVYKPGKIYFIGSAVDMWHPSVSDDDIAQVLSNCSFHYRMTPNALEKPIFMFQSKSPDRFKKFLGEMPPNSWLATTVETDDMDRYGDMSRAPSPPERIAMMNDLASTSGTWAMKTLLSIEPVMKWTDLDKFLELLAQAPWDMVSIGADSCGVIADDDEPDPFEITSLARELEIAGAKICIKPNCANLVRAADPRDYMEHWKSAGWILERETKKRKNATQLSLL